MRTVASHILWVLSIAVAAWCAGCASSASGPAADLPSIQAIKPDPDRLGPQAGALPAAKGVAAFQMIELPLHQPVDRAWALVDEGAFPAITRGAWNANGLRIGLLDRSKVRKFVEALPTAFGVRTEQMLGSSHPLPVLQTPRVRGVVTLNLTVPPMAMQKETVTGGRLQLLARMERDGRAGLVLDLLPHHYVPQLSLKPRSPLEKELDGRIFHELGVRAAVPPTHLLVVGLYRPWPRGEEEDEGAEEPLRPGAAPEEVARRIEERVNESPGTPNGAAGGRSEGGGASAGEGIMSAEPPPLPDHLGRALLATTGSRPQQLLLLISVEPLSGGAGVAEAPEEIGVAAGGDDT